MELVRFIEYRPDLATKHDIALLRKDMEALSKEIEHLANVSVTEAQLEKAIGNLAWKVASVARLGFWWRRPPSSLRSSNYCSLLLQNDAK